MAKVDIPRDDNDKKSESSSKRRKQKSYQDSLAYERAFLKKKEELSRSATTKQLRQEIDTLQKRAAVELDLARQMITDKTELERELANIRAKLASDLSKRQIELLSEQRKNEYAAHEFATACAMKSFQTQNVHQRAQTAAALADAQRVQTEKLKSIKTAEIAELKAQRKTVDNDEEKRKISAQIRKLQKEIADAEATEAKYHGQAAEYAKIAQRVDFDRLTAVEKLAKKEKELSDLRNESNSAIAEIDSEIAAKKIDLEAAESAGHTKKAESLRSDIDQLETRKTETSSNYDRSVRELQDSIEGSGGYRDQAKKSAGTRVTGVSVRSSENVDSDGNANQSDLALQLELILNSLNEFVSSFEDYVDAVEDRVVSSQAGPVVIPTVQDSLNSSKQGSQNFVNYLRSLVDQSATGDIELQTQLGERIDRLSDILIENPDADISTIIEPVTRALEELKTSSEESSKKSGSSSSSLGAIANDITARAKAELDEEKAGWKDRREEGALREAKYKLRRGDPEAMKEDAIEKSFEKLQGALDGLADMCRSIDNNINEYYRYQAEIDAKLQGTDLDYKGMIKTLTKNLGMSMLVPQTEYIQQFKKLVDSGIAHNMETRAFLATVSDKVVNTFNTFDANLLRLIRIQQNDSTAARLGLESTLNKLLNSQFSDSSYLSEGPHDAITGAILEASSMLSNNMSLEFEYMVHKWLGSLYSLGVSSDTLESIAQGLNYLGTGNVNALNSNESLQTLLALSANRGGESYAEILVNGLDADTTNNLLRGMITYLIEIASNTDNNQVTKSAYSDLFGLHMSDLRAIINLTENDINSLSSLTTTYSQVVNETENQLGQILNRTHISQMIENLFSNAVMGASLDIGGNPVTYGLWKVLNIVEGLTGGIALPFINVMGSGFDLNTTVTQLAKSGMAGLAMLGNLVGALASGGIEAGMSVSYWNNNPLTTRGSADKFLASGTQSGFSSSARIDYAGSGSSGDVKKTEMSDAADSASEDSSVTNKNQQGTENIPKETRDFTAAVWQSVAEGEDTIFKQTVVTNQWLQQIHDRIRDIDIDTMLSPSRVFLTQSVDSSLFSGLAIDPISGSIAKDAYRDRVNSVNLIKTLFTNVTESSSSPIDASTDFWSLISGGDTTTANTQLVSAISDMSQNIEVKEQLKNMAEIQQLNKIVFPEYVRATIDDFSPTVRKYSEALIKKAIEMNLYGVEDVGDYVDEDAQHPIIKQLKALFEDPTTHIRVEVD